LGKSIPNAPDYQTEWNSAKSVHRRTKASTLETTMKMDFPTMTVAQRVQQLMVLARGRFDGWLRLQAQSDVFQRRVDTVTGGSCLRRFY
jgi:hypothetical protein